ERGRKLGPLAVGIRQRIGRVLPTLAAHLGVARAVFDVPVAVRIAVRSVAPGERALGGGKKLAPQRAVPGPLHGLGEDQRAERCRVDGSVVGPVRGLGETRELATPQRVEDAAWPFRGVRSDIAAMRTG